MNCSDVSLILDDRDTDSLDDGLRKAIDAHLAACPDCTQEWKLHARLVARRLPALPPGLLDDCSALVATGHAVRTRRNWKLAALAASVAVLVAAAATLTAYRAPEPGSAAVASAPAAGTDPHDRSVAADTPSPSPPQHALQAQVSTPSVPYDGAPAPGMAAGSGTFSVRLSTLQNDTLETDDKTAFDVFRSAAIDELRRTPGLILVFAEATAAGEVVDYEMTLTAARRNGRLNGILRITKSGPKRVVLPIQGAFGQNCAPSCFEDAASLGEALARAAAKMMMPAAAAQRPALLKELQNSSLPPQQRLDALRDLDLRRSRSRSGPRQSDPSGDSLRDPAVIRAAIDLAFVATSPMHRGEIWWMMRSIRSPALVEPLAHAAQLDPDSTVRAEAVATLADDFASDPRARAAFELIARADSHPMVRALAQSGLSGEASWNSYVRASLEDRALSDAQRLDAILFHARSWAASDQSLVRLLDDDAIEALAEVLPTAEGAGLRTLLNHLASVKHPAITGMLLASIERRDPRFDRKLVMEMLADRLSEPEVRAAFEKIAASDADEQSRRIAQQGLRGGA